MRKLFAPMMQDSAGGQGTPCRNYFLFS